MTFSDEDVSDEDGMLCAIHAHDWEWQYGLDRWVCKKCHEVYAQRDAIPPPPEFGGVPDTVSSTLPSVREDMRASAAMGTQVPLIDEIPPPPSVPREMRVGVKHDRGKSRWALLPWGGVEIVVRVLMHGAAKYGDENWRAVLTAPGGEARYFDAALRHMIAWKEGEDRDADSGLPHLAHAACCVLFLLSEVADDKQA